MVTKITEAHAKKVLSVVDKGLTYGVGDPVPGKMCVEAAVAYAFDEDHTDEPRCVAYHLRSIKIDLNDTDGWSSDKARARGLRRVAIAQLGSADKFDVLDLLYDIEEDYLDFVSRRLPKIEGLNGVKEFWQYQQSIAESTYTNLIDTLENNLAQVINTKGTQDQLVLEVIAELIVRALIKQNVPGTKFLRLAPLSKKLQRYFNYD